VLTFLVVFSELEEKEPVFTALTYLEIRNYEHASGDVDGLSSPPLHRSLWK
jgi:hypothetical protein